MNKSRWDDELTAARANVASILAEHAATVMEINGLRGRIEALERRELMLRGHRYGGPPGQIGIAEARVREIEAAIAFDSMPVAVGVAGHTGDLPRVSRITPKRVYLVARAGGTERFLSRAAGRSAGSQIDIPATVAAWEAATGRVAP